MPHSPHSSLSTPTPNRMSIPFSVPLPTSPTDSPPSSVISASPSSYQTPAPSPSSSASPGTHPRSRKRTDIQETEVDDSDSSDVEIYLSNLEIDNSITRMQPSTGLPFFPIKNPFRSTNKCAYSHFVFQHEHCTCNICYILCNDPASFARTRFTTFRAYIDISVTPYSPCSANNSTP